MQKFCDGDIDSDDETKCKAPAANALSSWMNCYLSEDEEDQGKTNFII